MRHWINLASKLPLRESAGMLPITPTLLAAVRKSFNSIDSSSKHLLGDDDVALSRIVADLLDRIDREEPISATMRLVRAELRPRQTLPNGIETVGNHWCWDENEAQVYHSDNAHEMPEWVDAGYGKDDFTSVTIVADVPFAAINWPFTIATNIRFPEEAEITVRNGASVMVDEVYWDETSASVNRSVRVSGNMG